jgi:hypothetical protein
MSKKKYTFQFGDWVEWIGVAEKKTYNGNRTINPKEFYKKHPVLGRVVGYVIRHEGVLENIGYEEGNAFASTKSILLVQVRRSLTSKIEECFPEQVSPAQMRVRFEFSNSIYNGHRWSDKDKEEMRREAFLMKRDAKGRFVVTSMADRKVREAELNGETT